MPVTLLIKPLGDRVVVRPKPKDETTSSGIVLPDTASEKPQEGSVLSVGRSPYLPLLRRRGPMRSRKGQKDHLKQGTGYREQGREKSAGERRTLVRRCPPRPCATGGLTSAARPIRCFVLQR